MLVPERNADSAHWLDGIITFQGRQNNLAVRQAAVIALMFNVFMAAVATMSVMLTIPRGKQKS